MKRLVMRLGLAASVAAACSGKSERGSEATETGGAATARGGASVTGGRGDDSGGESPSVSGGRATNTGGRDTSSTGGAAASTGGTSASSGGLAGSGGNEESGGEAALGGSGGDGVGGSGGVVGSGGAGGSGGVGECLCGPLEQCFGTLCVALSVIVPNGFAIDATEVTRSQYAAWLAVRSGGTIQTTQCDWNQDFNPDPECMARASVCQGAACDEHPQPCVDFCDAAGYCRAIGKQLCGGIGGGSAARDGSDSEWLLTCTANATQDYPYGENFMTGGCNDPTAGSQSTVAVASLPGCQSSEPGYEGVFDLVGNLSEWEDNCNTAMGPADLCHLRGAAFGISAAAPRCDQTIYADRGSFSDSAGFRCCEPRPDR